MTRHEALALVTHDSAKSQLLASCPARCKFTSMNTRITQPFCHAERRAKKKASFDHVLHQPVHSSLQRTFCLTHFCLFFLVVFRPSILSQTRSACHKTARLCYSPPAAAPVLLPRCALLPLTNVMPINHALQGRGSPVITPGGGLSACLDGSSAAAALRTRSSFIASLEIQKQRKSSQGQLHTGGNYP